jgi:hypothetical protein
MSELGLPTQNAEQRQYAVELMKSRKGLNTYTNGGDRKYFFGKPDNIPGAKKQKGFSDCSSAVRKVMQAVIGVDIGSNTSAQVNNRKTRGKVVHETDGIYPDESVLLPGDCLYFKGNKAHALDVGHVEMYIGNGEICGHGGGIGPKIRKLKAYCKDRGTPDKRYFMAIRWISDENTDIVMTLFEGMNDNPRVQKLQLDLISLGYDLGKYGADGDFGKDTKSAVEQFQLTAGLDATGRADEETLKRIEDALDLIEDGDNDDDDAVADDNTPEPDPDVPGINPGNTVTVGPGTYFLRYGPGKEYDHDGQFVMEGMVLEVVDVENSGGWIPVKVVKDGKVQLRWLGPNAIV